MSTGAKVIIFFISLPLVVLLHGYAIQQLWKWFIASHFGLAELPFVTALGLGVFIGFLTSGLAEYRAADGIEFSEKLAFAIAKPVVALLIGLVYVMVLS